MQIRSTNKKIPDENKRFIDWFPVKKPFNLFHLYTDPLDTLEKYEEKVAFEIPVPDKISGSVQMILDIFPPKENITALPASLISIAPHFTARATFFATNIRQTATLLWPIDKELKL